MAALGALATFLVLWILVPQRLPTGIAPVPQAQRWLEPLSDITFDLQGFKHLTERDLASHTPPTLLAPPRGWQTVALPCVQELPTTTDRPSNASHRLWLRFKYVVPSSQPGYVPVGLYITRLMAGIGGGAYSLWVNGSLVQTNEAQWRMQWNHPVLVSLPLKFSQPGLVLDIALGIPFQMEQGYAVGSISMGPLPWLSPYRQLREFAQITLPQVTLFVVVLMGLMSLNFWLNRRTEETHLLLWLSSIAWLVCNLQFVMDFDSNDLLSRWFGSLVDSATGWAILLICLFAMRVEGRTPTWVERGATTLVAALTMLTLPMWGWQKNALLLQHYVHVAMAIVLIGIQIQHAVQTGKVELWLLAGSLVTMVIFGLHDLNQLTAHQGPDSIYLFPYNVILVFGAFIYANQKRYIGALNNVERHHTYLQQRIAEEQKKIQRNHEQLLALDRQHALMEERQQVCRDVHDGLGSALTSAILLAERGQVEPQIMSPALHDCLVEIQAVADTIHSTPGDLNALLRLLEARLTPRLEAAGIASSWELTHLAPMAWMDQAACNDLSRAVQEAITNAMKHGNPTHIQTAAAPREANGAAGVCITVHDDGRGFRMNDVQHGRGLKNLQSRSCRLHGQFQVRSQPGQGACVELWIPLTWP
jgi:signal transduction histidine kinase